MGRRRPGPCLRWTYVPGTALAKPVASHRVVSWAVGTSLGAPAQPACPQSQPSRHGLPEKVFGARVERFMGRRGRCTSRGVCGLCRRGRKCVICRELRSSRGKTHKRQSGADWQNRKKSSFPNKTEPKLQSGSNHRTWRLRRGACFATFLDEGFVGDTSSLPIRAACCWGRRITTAKNHPRSVSVRFGNFESRSIPVASRQSSEVCRGWPTDGSF